MHVPTALYVFLGIFVPLIIVVAMSLAFNGTGRTVRRKLGWAKRQHVDPVSFIGLVSLYRPEELSMRLFDRLDGTPKIAGGYAASFRVMVHGSLLQYQTIVSASVVPSDAQRLSMLMVPDCEEHKEQWDRWHPATKAFSRLLDHFGGRGYHGPASALSDAYHYGTVQRPADVIASEPKWPTRRTRQSA